MGGGRVNFEVQGASQAPAAAHDDLYSLGARKRIARALEVWLERQKATAFELLHRPDLADELEASGTDLQHAIQKFAIPEAQTRGCSVHELIRSFYDLVEAAIGRLRAAARRGALPDFGKETFAAAAERLAEDPQGTFLLSAGVAAFMAPAESWSDKTARVLSLAEAAPAQGEARLFAFSILAQPLAEILSSPAAVRDVLGKELDLGGSLVALTRLAAPEATEALMQVDPTIARVMPPEMEAARNLGKLLKDKAFVHVRAAIAKRILEELGGPRRLRPGDAAGEVELFRTLAITLTAARGLTSPEKVEDTLQARSAMFVANDFMQAYVAEKSALQEAEAVVWLIENLFGGANKRQASRWLKAAIASARFDKEVHDSAEPASARLAALARLQRACGRCGLIEAETTPIQAKLGALGDQIESEARLIAQVLKAGTPVVNRLTQLLRLACGETAPLGPAADRAKAEALKLMRHAETRAELAQAPDQVGAVRGLMQQAGLAA